MRDANLSVPRLATVRALIFAVGRLVGFARAGLVRAATAKDCRLEFIRQCFSLSEIP